MGGNHACGRPNELPERAWTHVSYEYVKKLGPVICCAPLLNLILLDRDGNGELALQAHPLCPRMRTSERTGFKVCFVP